MARSDSKRRKRVAANTAGRVSVTAPLQHAASNIQDRPDEPLPRQQHRWRTFPVFAAFFAGLLLAFLVNGGSANPVAFFVQLAALMGVGYSLARLIIRNIIAAGRLRRRGRARTSTEGDDEYEDVVVYDDE